MLLLWGWILRAITPQKEQQVGIPPSINTHLGTVYIRGWCWKVLQAQPSLYRLIP